MRTGYVIALVVIALLVGALVGYGATVQANPPKPLALKSNMELLGEVTTVVDDNDPLVRELREDDRRHGRK